MQLLNQWTFLHIFSHMSGELRAVMSYPVFKPTYKITNPGAQSCLYKGQEASYCEAFVQLCCSCIIRLVEREKSDHSNSMWHQYDSRSMDVIPPGTAQSALFLHTNPLIKLWNRFGLHHDSMQSGTEQGSIISWHAGVRGCISLHAGAVLCQKTSRFASTCRPGLHGSPEGNLILTPKCGEKNCSKGATKFTTACKISTYLSEHQGSVTFI